MHAIRETTKVPAEEQRLVKQLSISFAASQRFSSQEPVETDARDGISLGLATRTLKLSIRLQTFKTNCFTQSKQKGNLKSP